MTLKECIRSMKEDELLFEEFVVAEFLALRKFGYDSVTKDHIREQIQKIGNDEELDVIGMFIKGHIEDSLK